MYLMATHIPTYVDGERTYVDDSWYSDLVLARDFFAPHFGTVQLIAPQRPVADAGDTKLQEIGSSTEGLRVVPSIDERTRTRNWPSAARAWRRDLAPLIAKARVVHASIDDPFRAMQLTAMREALRAKKPTVLIGFDMDVWDTLPKQIETMSPVRRAMHVARTVGMDGWMRYAVRRASVAMLKEGLVFDRYSKLAKNPRAFCHSMHSDKHLITDAVYEARIASLQTGRPLRLGYFGRFVERKGIADAVRMVAAARDAGTQVRFDLVGWGPQESELRALVSELNVDELVRFEPALQYGEAFHAKLREYDALLFTPTEEDTPRMVYDVYAAGLPLLTTDIAFLRRRARSDGASELFGVGDIRAGARTLTALHEDRARLIALSRKAREAGRNHTIEHWYGRRLEWTLDALARR